VVEGGGGGGGVNLSSGGGGGGGGGPQGVRALAVGVVVVAWVAAPCRR